MGENTEVWVLAAVVAFLAWPLLFMAGRWCEAKRTRNMEELVRLKHLRGLELDTAGCACEVRSSRLVRSPECEVHQERQWIYMHTPGGT